MRAGPGDREPYCAPGEIHNGAPRTRRNRTARRTRSPWETRVPGSWCREAFSVPRGAADPSSSPPFRGGSAPRPPRVSDSPRRVCLPRLRAAGFSRNRFVLFVKPVLLEEVSVPAPSFRIGHGFEVHRLIPENVPERLLVTPPECSSQPLYFSRRSLSKQLRLIVNKDKLERQLAEKGYAIARPEKLTLERQIYPINKHEVIIGSLGSALHSALFDTSPQSGRNIVCLSYKDSSHTSYLLMDAIKKLNSTYMHRLSTLPILPSGNLITSKIGSSSWMLLSARYAIWVCSSIASRTS